VKSFLQKTIRCMSHNAVWDARGLSKHFMIYCSACTANACPVLLRAVTVPCLPGCQQEEHDSRDRDAREAGCWHTTHCKHERARIKEEDMLWTTLTTEATCSYEIFVTIYKIKNDVTANKIKS
jgi:hypothetical protein